jgi:hypothetical protein
LIVDASWNFLRPWRPLCAACLFNVFDERTLATPNVSSQSLSLLSAGCSHNNLRVSGAGRFNGLRRDGLSDAHAGLFTVRELDASRAGRRA